MIHFLLVASEGGAINSIVVRLPCSPSLLCTCSTLGRSYEVPARLWLDVMAVALLRQCWQTDFWGKCVRWCSCECSRCTNLSITGGWEQAGQPSPRPPNNVCPCLLTSSPSHLIPTLNTASRITWRKQKESGAFPPPLLSTCSSATFSWRKHVPCWHLKGHIPALHYVFV